MGSNQPPTEMNSRNISRGIKAAGAWIWQFCHFHVPIVWKFGIFISFETLGAVRVCTGIALQEEFTLSNTLNLLMLTLWKTKGHVVESRYDSTQFNLDQHTELQSVSRTGFFTPSNWTPIPNEKRNCLNHTADLEDFNREISLSQLWIDRCMLDGQAFYLFIYLFFKEIYCTENSARYTRLQNCSFNQFAIVVICRSEW